MLTQNFKEYNNGCKDDDGNYGNITKLYDCPYAVLKFRKGNPPNQICPYTVCDNLICCPNEFCENNPKCKKEYSKKIIDDRLTYFHECILFNNTNPGIYTYNNRCSAFYNQTTQNISLPRSCDWEMCKDFVCCPKSNITPSRKS